MEYTTGWKRDDLSSRIDFLLYNSYLSAETVKECIDDIKFDSFRTRYGYHHVTRLNGSASLHTRNKEKIILDRLDDWITKSYGRDHFFHTALKDGSKSPGKRYGLYDKSWGVKIHKSTLKDGLSNLSIAKTHVRNRSTSSPSTPLTLRSSHGDKELDGHMAENYTDKASSNDHVLDMIASAKTRSNKLANSSVEGAAERKLKKKRQKKGRNKTGKEGDSLSVCSGASVDTESLQNAELLAHTANKYGTLPRMKFNFNLVKSTFEDVFNSGSGQDIDKEQPSESKRRNSTKSNTKSRRKSFLRFYKSEKREKDDNLSHIQPMPSTSHQTSLPIETYGQGYAEAQGYQKRNTFDTSVFDISKKEKRQKIPIRKRLLAMPLFYVPHENRQELGKV